MPRENESMPRDLADIGNPQEMKNYFVMNKSRRPDKLKQKAAVGRTPERTKIINFKLFPGILSLIMTLK